MKYRNTVTGAIVDVDSKIHGNWEPLEIEAPVSVEEKVEPKKTTRRKKTTEK